MDVLAPVLGPPRYQQFATAADEAAAALDGRAVINVNSTATGGGVAEMLQSLLAYARGIGIDIRWLTVAGDEPFFAVTKRLHNRIYGVRGDDGALGSAERKTYERVLADQADDLLTMAKPSDVVLLHDPQTLGLAPTLHRAGVPVVWRCHIGADADNDRTQDGWDFLGRYLEDVDLVVVSRETFAPPGFPGDRVVVIPPSIDPLAVKNAPLTEADIDAILGYTGLVQGPAGQRAVFPRRDGSPERLDRQADVLQLGPPPPKGAPLVVQVSRWDRLKDMAGVMQGFADHVDGTSDAHLILAGPNVTGVADDPEGAAVLEDCTELWRRLPHAKRRRIHLACLPTADVDENAAIVNALQRRATVVTQKSLAEGFGLTVVEAMWKARPVVASAVGGIVDQISDDGCGLLLDDPTDLEEFGRQVRTLLDNPELAAKIGAAAQERARDFLPDVHLTRWATLLARLVDAS
jgi:trehalose synthase